ncbi:aldehyde dehydrogenase family protein [Mobilicoccus caccae]|uniref:Aldehyde dehydrogenase n=1 Tax=Mobilicoccus caccae TaxID=1859295 RepID=A0ABQ6IWN1_9MICO|nr:aldehyde dehydrogenase family protein [Mobilicoccus caccae]GMA41103.1 aldehyde dehydrogenase [Mobilicoccus caccae]
MSVTPAVDAGHDPRTGERRAGLAHTTPDELAAILDRAVQAAPVVAGTAPATRAAWLDAVADGLEAHADELVAIADAETALGSPRLPGELAKAAAQARFYGSVAAEGSFVDARIDTAGGPAGVDLRRARRPVGPVAVFGASNFPFGFGVAGHDTCSALAAGCPVVVKAHPAHPELSGRLAQVVADALTSAGAPEGAFALVVGFDSGLALVDADQVAAVGFTGSQTGGMALVERAAARPRPIPVYAEMGTVNPAVVTRAGAAGRAEDIACGFVESFTLGAGQFCTKPGLLLVPAGSEIGARVADLVAERDGAHALTQGIAAAYATGRSDLEAAGARVLADGRTPGAGNAVQAVLAQVDAKALTPGSRLLEECFGPLALVVEYASDDQRDQLLTTLQPSLAAAVASGGEGDTEVACVVELLSHQVGRVVVDGWPTGVAGTWAQHHGGPWPATSRPDATSVGAAALDRFTRPVAYQDVPASALPPELTDDNPWGLPRRMDGRLQQSGDSDSDGGGGSRGGAA